MIWGIIVCIMLWSMNYAVLGLTAELLLACVLASALLVLSVVDWKTHVIPTKINGVIACLGVANLFLHREQWQVHILGLFCGGGLFLLVYYLTRKRGIGGGDVKLMAAAGLYLGWELLLVASFLGCLYACILHLLRMRICKVGPVFALGPYLAAGIMTALWFGEALVA